jgi:hypothetical protein
MEGLREKDLIASEQEHVWASPLSQSSIELNNRLWICDRCWRPKYPHPSTESLGASRINFSLDCREAERLIKYHVTRGYLFTEQRLLLEGQLRNLVKTMMTLLRSSETLTEAVMQFFSTQLLTAV